MAITVVFVSSCDPKWVEHVHVETIVSGNPSSYEFWNKKGGIPKHPKLPYVSILKWSNDLDDWGVPLFLEAFIYCWLVVFDSVGNVIIPTDEHIFQRGWNHQPAMIYGKYWDMAHRNIIYTLWLWWCTYQEWWFSVVTLNKLRLYYVFTYWVIFLCDLWATLCCAKTSVTIIYSRPAHQPSDFRWTLLKQCLICNMNAYGECCWLSCT